LRIRDDTSMIGCRIKRHDFERMGKQILEEVPVGAHLLIRANFYPGFRFGFIQRWMRLDAPAAGERVEPQPLAQPLAAAQRGLFAEGVAA
jgi:hypothetical protein